MASYYYLLSSLPELQSDGAMPLTYDEFLDLCQPNVSNAIYKRLEELDLTTEEEPLVNTWTVFFRNLMGELNYQRSVNLGKTCPLPCDREPAAVQAVGAALSAENPLAAEKILLAYEFEALDSLVGLHIFDGVCLFGYAMKLKLLERQSCFIQEKGQKEFKRLFDQVQQRIYSL